MDEPENAEAAGRAESAVDVWMTLPASIPLVPTTPIGLDVFVVESANVLDALSVVAEVLRLVVEGVLGAKGGGVLASGKSL